MLLHCIPEEQVSYIWGLHVETRLDWRSLPVTLHSVTHVNKHNLCSTCLQFRARKTNMKKEKNYRKRRAFNGAAYHQQERWRAYYQSFIQIWWIGLILDFNNTTITFVDIFVKHILYMLWHTVFVAHTARLLLWFMLLLSTTTLQGYTVKADRCPKQALDMVFFMILP